MASMLKNFIQSLSPEIFGGTKPSPERPGLPMNTRDNPGTFPARPLTNNPLGIDHAPSPPTGEGGVDMSRSSPKQVQTPPRDDKPGKTYGMADYRRAIRAVESDGSGGYGAIGGRTKKGDRAYGAYQVMDFNIPSWTKKYYGKQLTPQEFLNNEAAQDAVFDGEFGGYLDKYGNFNDAMSMWFSGMTADKAGNASDGNLSVPEYIAKGNRYLNGAPTPNSAAVRGADDFNEMGYDPRLEPEPKDDDFADALEAAVAPTPPAPVDYAKPPAEVAITSPSPVPQTVTDFKKYLNDAVSSKDRQSPAVKFFEQMLDTTTPKVAEILGVPNNEALNILRSTAADYAASPDDEGLADAVAGGGGDIQDVDLSGDLPQDAAEDDVAEAVTGVTVSPVATSTSGTPAVTTPDQSGVEEPEQVTSGFVDRMMDKVYGKDTDPEIRTDRKRALTLAMAAGFRELAGGAAADYQSISNDRVGYSQARTAAAKLQKDGQALSDLMVASGRPELAQLPLMGAEGMTAAMGVLTSQSKATSGGTPGYRAALAATLMEQGQPALARGIMELQGADWDTLHQSVLGMTADSAKGPTADNASYPPAAREAAAASMERSGNADAAAIIRSGAPASVVSEYLKSGTPKDGGDENKAWTPAALAQAANDVQVRNPKLAEVLRNPGVPDKVKTDAYLADLAVDPALKVEQGKTDIEIAKDKSAVDQQADAYAALGHTGIATAVRKAGNTADAAAAVTTAHAREQVQIDRDLVKSRGEAVANTISALDSDLQEAARNSITSQDLDNVMAAALNRSGITLTQKDYQRAKVDPEFAKYVLAAKYAESGLAPPGTRSEQAVLAEISDYGESFRKAQGMQKRLRTDMEMIRAQVVNPGVKTGALAGYIGVPLQSVAYSVLGDSAQNMFASDGTLVASAMTTMAQNGNFATASADLKGAISEVETKAFMSLFPKITDDRVKVLAMTQYYDKSSKLRDAEYNATLDWLADNEAKGATLDRRDLAAAVEKATVGMEVFKTFTTAADLDAYKRSGKAIDEYEIVMVRNSRGVAVPMAVGGSKLIEGLR